MRFATNNGVRIAYETEGEGPPLVLHIGFLGSLEDWRRPDVGYAAALRDKYRLLMLDPRGQGNSDGPHDPAAYTRRERVGDVLAVLDAEGIAHAHYWGYSMGGTIGFALGAIASDRVDSLILGGAIPFPANEQAADDHPWLPLLREGMDAFVADWERNDPAMPAEMRERWLRADAQALAAAFQARRPEPEIADALPKIRTPTLIYYGTLDFPDDRPADAGRAMPNATVAALEGLNHAQAFRRSDLVLPHVEAFLAQIDRGSPPAP